MAARLHELVWVAALLDACPNVDALSVRVETDQVRTGDGWVSSIAVDVHAASHDDAARLAQALHLREVEGRVTESEHYGASVWRSFRGWAADGSREAPVLVQVTGADLATALAPDREVA